jgi:hypothetical protein
MTAVCKVAATQSKAKLAEGIERKGEDMVPGSARAERFSVKVK